MFSRKYDCDFVVYYDQSTSSNSFLSGSTNDQHLITLRSLHLSMNDCCTCTAFINLQPRLPEGPAHIFSPCRRFGYSCCKFCAATVDYSAVPFLAFLDIRFILLEKNEGDIP